MGSTARWCRWPCGAKISPRVIDGLRSAGFAGVNVTVPHKEAAFALAHSLDAAARAAGAVNLLVFRDGEIEGRNTDSLGLASLAGRNR